MLHTVRRFVPRPKLVAALAALTCSLAMGLALHAASASASALPGCVTVIRDYPVTGAKNNCAFTLGVQFRYAGFTSSSPCYRLAPGAKVLESNWGVLIETIRCA